MSFLAIRYKSIVTTPASAGVPEVRNAAGEVTKEAVEPVAEVREEVIDACYTEDDAGTVARNLADPELSKIFEFYEIELNGRDSAPTLHRVQLKSGEQRTVSKPVAEVEANGNVVGEAEVSA